MSPSTPVFKINLFFIRSVVQLLVMIGAGFVQLFLIRSIFDEKSSVHKLWK